MNRGSRNRSWWLVLLALNLALIWGNSLLPGTESAKLSRWVSEIFAGLFGTESLGGISGEGLLRKAAHFAEFACLGMLLTQILIKREKKNRAPVIPALLGCLLAACLDETIQIFVVGRGSSLLDVWIDFSGAAVGMMILLIGHYVFTSKNLQHKTEETT